MKRARPFAVVPAPARGTKTDEREAWEARVYLRLVFEDLALLFDSALVGCLPDWGRGRVFMAPSPTDIPKSRSGCAAGCSLSRGHYGGCVVPSSAWSGNRTPCSAGHDNDVWCDYCSPRGRTPAA